MSKAHSQITNAEDQLNTELIGMLSGALVIVSAIPYALRTYQRKIKPNITSWTLWSLIALALLLSYKSSGAEDNIWPAVFAFTNPIIITGIAIWRRGQWEPITKWEKLSIAGCIFSLILWWVVKDHQELVQFALYLAIVADICAAIPTIIFVWEKPAEDRPGAWGMFAFAYGLAIFAITDHTIANYALPIYMFCGASSVTFLLARYRWRTKAPINEWF